MGCPWESPRLVSNDPVQVFHKLFSADDMPLEQRQAAIAEKRSVLDAVVSEAKRVQYPASRAKIQKSSMNISKASVISRRV